MPTTTKKKADRPSKKIPPDGVGKQFLTYLCPDTFDVEKFSKRHQRVYSQEEMDHHDALFRDQSLFNFDSARVKLRKADRDAGRNTRSTVADLNSDLGNAL